MEQEFHKIKRLPPYVFAEVNEMKAQARAAEEDIIDLGMGNPDMPPPAHIIDKLVETVQNPGCTDIPIQRESRGCGAPCRRIMNVDLMCRLIRSVRPL
jgi:alanine-synthesizing transaminase